MATSSVVRALCLVVVVAVCAVVFQAAQVNCSMKSVEQLVVSAAAQRRLSIKPHLNIDGLDRFHRWKSLILRISLLISFNNSDLTLF
jgi:hypothetical protein